MSTPVNPSTVRDKWPAWCSLSPQTPPYGPYRPDPGPMGADYRPRSPPRQRGRIPWSGANGNTTIRPFGFLSCISASLYPIYNASRICNSAGGRLHIPAGRTSRTKINQDCITGGFFDRWHQPFACARYDDLGSTHRGRQNRADRTPSVPLANHPMRRTGMRNFGKTF
jgi:hypothetical protein